MSAIDFLARGLAGIDEFRIAGGSALKNIFHLSRTHMPLITS